jgi:phosphatidylethanolamine/phosphatidyl-N-methylethanolamine N-methyltransferase
MSEQEAIMAHESHLFLRQLLTKPKQISAIAPSSPWLARAMAQGLGPASGRVVEFGPGTGALTRAILAAGVAPENITLFEMNPEFATHLRLAMPRVTVHHAPAQAAVGLVDRGVERVISGLPLLSMPPELRRAIVQAAFDILGPDGVFTQFTYGPNPPLSPEVMVDLGICVTKGPKIWANLPPARVYNFHRQ